MASSLSYQRLSKRALLQKATHMTEQTFDLKVNPSEETIRLGPLAFAPLAILPPMLPFPHGPPIFSWPGEGVFLDRGQPLGDINGMGFTGASFSVGRTIR
jgi:hypothetical protein